MRTITVKGTGNVSARPDYIILSLNIEVLSETYDRAMLEAAERIERLQGAAVRVGYRKEDLKTTSFDVQTRYENVNIMSVPCSAIKQARSRGILHEFYTPP